MHALLKKNVDPFGLFNHLKRKEREKCYLGGLKILFFPGKSFKTHFLNVWLMNFHGKKILIEKVESQNLERIYSISGSEISAY